MKKNWHLAKNIPLDFQKKFPGYNPVVLQLLYNRGFRDAHQIEEFLEPKYEKLSSPFELTDMDKAVSRILKSVAQEEKITIYADYDADAVTACAVMYYGLKQLGATDVSYYIPDRFSEGYGMNLEAIRQISSDGAKLMITVDCGINSVKEVALANELGLDVIVTDHHHITGKLPKAVAVVNHKRDEREDLSGITGVGMAFKLVQALFFVLHPESYGEHKWKKPKLKLDKKTLTAAKEKLLPNTPPHWEKWLLDLVAIGTVADIQSLLGESRILVKYGLQVMGKTRWAGLKQIFRNAGVDEFKKFDTFDIGFIIAPRINAAGRIQHADIALKLLISQTPEEASMYAGQLEQLNTHRQRLTEQIFSEARSQIELQHHNKILVAIGEEWPKGVVGLVASRLVEEFNRPTVVLEKSNGQATGSGRSVGDFDLVEALTHVEVHLERYGGHAGAAGLTLKEDKIELFRQAITDFAQDKIKDALPEKLRSIDAVLEPGEVSLKLVKELKKFEPHGPGNPPPVFLLSGLRLENLKLVGVKGKHLRVKASKDKHVLNLIGFSKGYLEKQYRPGESVDVLVEPSENVWNGRTDLQLRILDIKKS